MAYTIAPAVRAILDQANALWPDRSRISDGTIGDPSHAARQSDHNPGHNGMVHAADLTHDPAHGVDCNVLAEQVKDDPRVKYVIWNRRIWNPSISRSWRHYTGSNPHDKHMHVSVTDAGESDTRPWFDTAPDQGGLTVMDKATEDYLDSHFFAQLIATKKSELRLHQLIKRKFAKDRERDEELEGAIRSLEQEIEALERQADKVGR